MAVHVTTRGVATVAVVALAVWACGVAFCHPARAHEPYNGWRQPDRPDVSCCDNTDCRPVRAYLGEDGLWRAWNDVEWLTILPGKLLPPDFANDGRKHLCEKEGRVFCFSPSRPKS